MNWYAVYSKSRTEKKLAERLSAKGFEVYAPTQTVVRQWSDRKKKVQEVLFKSYVFVRFDLKQKLAVLQTPGAVALVHWLGRPAVIRDEEIAAIQAFLRNHADVRVEKVEYLPGQNLKVKSGQLQNAEGTVLRQSKHKVVLELEQLGMSIIAELPKSQVERLS